MGNSADEHLDTLWGARAIGEYVGLGERQASYLLENGHLPGRKIGDRWIATREELRLRLIGGEPA